MAIGVSGITGQAMEVELDGKVWKFSPLTIDDYGELEQAIKNEIVTSAIRSLEGSALSDAQQRMVMQAAFSRSEAVSIENVTRMSINMVRKQVYLSLRHHHPDMTMAAVNELLSPNQSGGIKRVIEIINGAGGRGDGAADGAGKS